VFRQLEPDLKRMFQEGKVDVSVAAKIELIEKSLSESASKWAQSKEVNELDAFAMYHALRVSFAVAERFRKRILVSKETNDNPLVVEESVTGFYGKKVTVGIREALHSRTRQLRDQAEDLGMYPSFAEETKGVDKGKLRRQAERVAATAAKQIER
jgi:hypothetical protein